MRSCVVWATPFTLTYPTLLSITLLDARICLLTAKSRYGLVVLLSLVFDRERKLWQKDVKPHSPQPGR